MLVLARKTNETIRMPELGVDIQILRIRGKSVSIGISAPSSVKVLRGELLESSPMTSSRFSRNRSS